MARGVAPGRQRLSAAAVALATALACVAATQRSAVVATVAKLVALDYGQHTVSGSTTIGVSNAYERGSHKIGDGLYPWTVVELHLATRLEANPPDNAMEYAWSIGSGVDASDPALIDANRVGAGSVEVVFTAPGLHTLTLSSRVSGEVLETKTVKATYVRREIRTLTDAAREAFLSALETTYKVDQKDGEQLYGSKYKSMASLVELHLQGAASKSCDHWHDDAGILTHHMGFTLQLEQSLQAIDNTVAMPYWDYTADAYYLGIDQIHKSQIFQPDWLGAISPKGEDHVVDEGRWAYTEVHKYPKDSDRDLIRNPYGLLRSPWNTDKTPFITRYKDVLGVRGGGFSVPGCSDFKTTYKKDWIGDFFSDLNGALHGPVHIIIGGQWDFDSSRFNLTMLDEESGMPEASGFFLLSSKFLWRQGFVRCPEFCSDDTGNQDCECTCPREITENWKPYEVMQATGQLDLNNGWLEPLYLLYSDMDWKDMWHILCHVGHAGEMFTSAAPYDPTFWPLHGLAERFLSYKRVQAAAGETTLNETWGYTHMGALASDTDVVCDWTGVEGMGLPTCTRQTCAGHKKDDLLPFGNFLDKNETYTNEEFYRFTAPTNEDLPYAYDSLSSWPACDAQGIDFTVDDADDDDADDLPDMVVDDASNMGPLPSKKDAGALPSMM